MALTNAPYAACFGEGLSKGTMIEKESIMENVKIGDKVVLVAPSGNKRTVIVTDVIRSIFDRKNILAIEFNGHDGLVTLPSKFFQTV